MKHMGILIAALGLFLFVQAAYPDWTPAKRLTWNSGISIHPALARDSSENIHIVWSDSSPAGSLEVFFKKSEDGGTTWSAARRLTWNSGGSYDPGIALDSTNAVHVVWHDDSPGNPEIYYRKSTDGGTTWSATQRLSWTSGNSFNSAIAIDSSNIIHVVWVDITPGKGEIYYSRSADQGTTWSVAQRLTWTSGSSNNPAMAIDATDAIHLVWNDGTPGNVEIYYMQGTDGGATWSAAKRLTWTSGKSEIPAIATTGISTLRLVWNDDTPGNHDIYYKGSPDGGATWSSAQRLTWSTGDSEFPEIALDASGIIHVVWRDDTPGNGEIYYKGSTDGGTTWSLLQRLTWNSGSSLYPVLAVDTSGTIHVVWQDSTPGNYELYYKNGY